MAKKQLNGTFPSALLNFDSLPDAAHVRQPVVEALFGCSAATIWRRVRDGRIPSPLKFSSRITAWNVGELRAVLVSIPGHLNTECEKGGSAKPRTSFSK